MTMYPAPPPVPVDALRIRQALGRRWWGPPEPFDVPGLHLGPYGWVIPHKAANGHVIVTPSVEDDEEWIHASMAFEDRLPTYDEMKLLHRAVFGDGWAYQVFAPPAEHVNIHANALHLFGRLDGAAVLPDFTRGTGSI